jgi:peptide/nickel transport system permease protein
VTSELAHRSSADKPVSLPKSQSGELLGEAARPQPHANPQRPPGPFAAGVLRTIRNPMGALGLAILMTLVLVAITAPFIAPFDPAEQHPGYELRPPGAPYLLGTDDFGRDVLSRIIFGSQLSLLVGVVAVLLGAGLGTPVGFVGGYFSGWLDSVLMRVCDALLAMPGLLMAIAVIAILGSGTVQTAVAVAIVSVPEFARLARATVLGERDREYVHAAVSLGCPHHRVMLRHLLPNCTGPLLVQLSLAMGFAVLASAALSFLGLGTGPPAPSWGGMLHDSREYLRQAPWYGVFPGVALALLLVGLNYLSDALREAFDPRSSIG